MGHGKPLDFGGNLGSRYIKVRVWVGLWLQLGEGPDISHNTGYVLPWQWYALYWCHSSFGYNSECEIKCRE